MFGIATLLFAVSIGYWAVLVYLPLVFTGAFGWSSDTAGIALLAATLPMLLLPPLGSRLAGQLGWRHHFSVALAIMTAGNAIIAIGLAMSGQTLAPIICGMIAIGVGVALAHPQLSGAVVALVPGDQAGMASAVTVVMRQSGFAIGIAILGAVIHVDGASISYVWLFVAATVASMMGLAAALVFLPLPAASPARCAPVRKERKS
jgi:MFS family permease